LERLSGVDTTTFEVPRRPRQRLMTEASEGGFK